MKFAIIDFAGKQHQVTPDAQITIPGNFGAVGTLIPVNQVLLAQSDQLQIGTPNITLACQLKILSLGKTSKTQTQTYKAKSRHRRHVGGRQATTTFQVIFPVKKVAKTKNAPTSRRALR